MTFVIDSFAPMRGDKLRGLIEEDSGEDWSMKNLVFLSLVDFSKGASGVFAVLFNCGEVFLKRLGTRAGGAAVGGGGIIGGGGEEV